MKSPQAINNADKTLTVLENVSLFRSWVTEWNRDRLWNTGILFTINEADHL